MKHIDIKEIFTNSEFIGKEVTVCGWVRTSRNSKTMAFLALNDGTSLPHLQIVIDKATGIEFEDAMPGGTSVKVVGTVVEGQNGGVEINAKEITVLGKCPAEYPLQKKRHTLEFLRTMPERPHEYLQCRDARPQRPGTGNSPLLPGAQLRLCQHTAYHRLRLRGCR